MLFYFESFSVSQWDAWRCNAESAPPKQNFFTNMHLSLLLVVSPLSPALGKAALLALACWGRLRWWYFLLWWWLKRLCYMKHAAGRSREVMPEQRSLVNPLHSHDCRHMNNLGGTDCRRPKGKKACPLDLLKTYFMRPIMFYLSDTSRKNLLNWERFLFSVQRKLLLKVVLNHIRSVCPIYNQKSALTDCLKPTDTKTPSE